MTYTVKEEATLKEMYADGALTSVIADKLGKSDKSVIGKLVSLKLYKPKAKVSKVTGGAPKTKASYVKDIELILEAELPDLEKAPKGTLITLLTCIEEWLGPYEEDEVS